MIINYSNIYKRVTIDKASENLILMRVLQQEYSTNYSTIIYGMKCVAHILNNAVFDVLKFLLPFKKNDDEIRNFTNEENNEIDEEETLEQQSCK